jgi:chorismate dehydratase
MSASTHSTRPAAEEARTARSAHARHATVRIGAVGYLNARPLTWALDRAPDRWKVRYDLPSVCARLLHDDEVDLGLVPSIEYLRSDDYRFVPGVGIGSRGPVASVALFTRRPVADIRHIALDTSSRTSVTLIRVLCHRRYRIAPEFVPHGPDLATMVRDYDAGLLIGDPALEADPAALGVTKIDLGAEWSEMTGLPFVYAAWTGRAGAIGAEEVRLLQDAQAEGVASYPAIAAEYGNNDVAATHRALVYLRDNMRYGLGSDEEQGLQLFLDYAADLGLAPRRRKLKFF